ncbi:MAG: hypothetical protein JWO08_4251 [Verrucomicrobiaceae bacterium]|nr:hypothetical protein [Verrucomicrobiaceae bacterium]
MAQWRMSILNAMPVDPKELRSLLLADIDRLPDEHLAVAHRFLQEMEIRHLMDSLGEAADAAEAAGKMSAESIQEAILEHRRKHPYQ